MGINSPLVATLWFSFAYSIWYIEISERAVFSCNIFYVACIFVPVYEDA